MIVPEMGILSAAELEQLKTAIEAAQDAVADHQTWLEEELLPRAAGDFRIGIRHGLATALLGVGQVQEAESILDELIREGNSEPQIRFMRGRSRLELRRLESAVEDLKISHAAILRSRINNERTDSAQGLLETRAGRVLFFSE